MLRNLQNESGTLMKPVVGPQLPKKIIQSPDADQLEGAEAGNLETKFVKLLEASPAEEKSCSGSCSNCQKKSSS